MRSLIRQRILIHHSREERTLDEFGLVRSSSSTSGEYCSDYEVLAWAELPFVRRPQEVLSREGKLGGDGECDFQDPSFAPFENHERWEFDSNGKVGKSMRSTKAPTSEPPQPTAGTEMARSIP